jgi:hypothetical protein
MEGLGAALLFMSRWGCSVLRAVVREKEEGEREKKRKGRKRKDKNMENFPDLKISKN